MIRAIFHKESFTCFLASDFLPPFVLVIKVTNLLGIPEWKNETVCFRKGGKRVADVAKFRLKMQHSPSVQ